MACTLLMAKKGHYISEKILISPVFQRSFRIRHTYSMAAVSLSIMRCCHSVITVLLSRRFYRLGVMAVGIIIGALLLVLSLPAVSLRLSHHCCILPCTVHTVVQGRYVLVLYVPVRYIPAFLRPRTFHPWCAGTIFRVRLGSMLNQSMGRGVLLVVTRVMLG